MSKSERVKKLRRYLNISQEEFGNKLGISKSAISKIEKNEFEPAQRTTKAICREFNVSYTWLVNGEGEMFVKQEKSSLNLLSEEYNIILMKLIK